MHAATPPAATRRVAEGATTVDGASSRRTWLARGAWVLLALALAVVVWTHRDYGVTWDEPAHVPQGRKLLAYYASGFDPQYAEAGTDSLGLPSEVVYGGLFNLGLALVEAAFPSRPFWETRHLFNALVALLGVAGCARLAASLGGAGAAFFATLLMLSFPGYMGHAFFNVTDLPFAVGYVWSVYFLVRFIRNFPRIPPGIAVGIGLSIGCAAAVRVGGLVLLCYLWLAFLAAIAVAPRGARPRAAAIGRMAFVLLGSSALAYGAMIAFWPWAQQSPFVRPLQSLALQTRHLWLGDVLFQGSVTPSTSLPWYFTLKHMLVQTPEIHLVACLLLVPLLVRALRSARSSRAELAVLLVAFTALFPVFYTIARRSNLFDSFRHLLFVVPPAIALLGYAIEVCWVEHPRWRKALAGALTLGLGVAAWDILALHPYEYVYYNRLVGGVRGAADSYELDYWGSSYKELIETLSASLPDDRAHTVFIDGPFQSAKNHLPAHLVLAWSADGAEYVLALNRTRGHLRWQGREVARVARSGALLSVALRVRSAR